MGSSGSGDMSSALAALQQSSPATPMPGLPVAGKDSTIGDAYEYGKFQNFLPDIKADGPNDSATGLRPDMFAYRKPSNPRDELAQTMAAPAPAAQPAANVSRPDWVAMRSQMSPSDLQTFQSQVPPDQFKAFMNATG